jgi:hypothetical protein
MLNWLGVPLPKRIDGEPLWLPNRETRSRNLSSDIGFSDPELSVSGSVG